MSLTLQEIEWLHDNGKMPDWAYYQQNGKSAQENFNLQRKKILAEIEQREAERRKREQEAQERKKLEKELEAQVQEQVEQAIEKALAELLKDFG